MSGWRDCTLVAFDTETTGLNPEEGHRVIEFAGIEFKLGPDGAIQKLTPHHYLFNPEIPIPREATEVSGLRDEDVADKPLFAQHAMAILKLLSNAILVAHNFPFDQRFLTYEFARANLRWPGPPAEIDTIDISHKFFPEARSHKLSELSQRLEVSLVGAHRATNDAEACGRCFLEMARRFGAPDSLPEMIEWADGVGAPPLNDFIKRTQDGQLLFSGGEFDGKPMEEHPEHLAWMLVAKVFEDGAWRDRYPLPLRLWMERWLRIRARGRAPSGNRGFGAGDWGIDPPVGSGLAGW